MEQQTSLQEQVAVDIREELRAALFHLRQLAPQGEWVGDPTPDLIHGAPLRSLAEALDEVRQLAGRVRVTASTLAGRVGQAV